jgi:DNA-binding transcriptional ArsR family regulator
MTQQQLRRLKKLLSSKKTKESFKICRSLCGSMRFKIIFILNKQKSGLTVTEMAKILDVSLSRVSHQLRILKKYRLVLTKRINREVVYILANHRIQKIFSF